MNNETLDGTCEIVGREALERYIAVQVSIMRQHKEGSLDYNRARGEYSRANAALCIINGDSDMQKAYEREARHYEKLVKTPTPQ